MPLLILTERKFYLKTVRISKSLKDTTVLAIRFEASDENSLKNIQKTVES
jgi:hypothetical protein